MLQGTPWHHAALGAASQHLHVAEAYATRLLHCAVCSCTPVLHHAGALCRQHDILFLKNSRFAGLKFPNMSQPFTLDAKFHGVMTPDALDFLK